MGELESYAKAIAKRLKPAMQKADEPKAQRDIFGTMRVQGTGDEAIATVMLDGSTSYSPCTCTCEVHQGDRVMCHIVNHRIIVFSNITVTSVNDGDYEYVKSVADEANELLDGVSAIVAEADTTLDQIIADSVSANSIVSSMQDAADTAGKTLAQIVSDADSAAETLAEMEEAAEAANTTLSGIYLVAMEASAAASEAKESAEDANAYANAALTQLSFVEDVAGTLTWIQQHGTFVETSDTTVQEGTVYFVYNSQTGDYEPIAVPPHGSNPHDLGWYVLDTTQSQSDYIMAHLAVTSLGLWVLPSGITYTLSQDTTVQQNTVYYTRSGAGTAGNPYVYTEVENPTGNPSTSGYYVHIPQYSEGYKMLLSSNGVYIYDSIGAPVVHYGENTSFASNRDWFVGNQDAFIFFDESENTLQIGGTNVTIGGKAPDDLLTSLDVSVTQTSSGADITVNGDTVHISNGGAGDPGCSYDIAISPSVLVRDEEGTLQSSSITLSATVTEGSGSPSAYAGRFKIEDSADGVNWNSPAKYTSNSNESSKTWATSGLSSTAKFVRCTLYKAGGTTTQLDTQTVPIVQDGAGGEDGEDAYTVMLTNEAHVFPATTTAAISSSTTTTVIAYKGATAVTPSIGTVTTGVTGLSASVDSTTKVITFTASSSLTTQSGTVNVPVTVDGITFNLVFSWSLALQGQNGKMLYGTCGTTASTAAKTVTCSDAESLYTGLAIVVKFSTANTADSPTLNVNSKGAKSIYIDNTVVSSSNLLYWNTNAVMQFVYDATLNSNAGGWVLVDQPTSYNATCSTTASTTVKNADCAASVVRKGTTATVKFSNAHTGSNAATLRLTGNDSAAKAIKSNGRDVTSSNANSWLAGETLVLVFDGSVWQTTRDDKGNVEITVTAINWAAGTATIKATLYVNGTAKTTGVSYQWAKNGTSISGGTSQSLAITSTSGTIDGLNATYQCTCTWSDSLDKKVGVIDLGASASVKTVADGYYSSINNTLTNSYYTKSEVDVSVGSITSRVTATESAIRGTFAICETNASTTDKVATISPTDSSWTRSTGSTVTVKFTKGNSASSPRLNVNSSGAAYIRNSEGNTMSYAERTWAEGQLVTFTFDGTYWRLQDGTTLSTMLERMSTAESSITQYATEIEARVEKDGVIAAINASVEEDGGSAVKISADKVQINGTAIFTAIKEDVETAVADGTSDLEHFVRGYEYVLTTDTVAQEGIDYYTLSYEYNEVELEVGDSIVGYYTKSGSTYTEQTSGTAVSGVKYYRRDNVYTEFSTTAGTTSVTGKYVRTDSGSMFGRLGSVEGDVSGLDKRMGDAEGVLSDYGDFIEVDASVGITLGKSGQPVIAQLTNSGLEFTAHYNNTFETVASIVVDYDYAEAETTAGTTDVTGLYVLVNGRYVQTADTVAQSGTTYYERIDASASGRLKVHDAVILEELQFGDWKWMPRKNGNLALKWIGE